MPSDLIWPHARSTPKDIDTGSHVWLRVLGTTDVHAHLLPHDYPRDTAVQDYGLARTATLIRRARAEARNTVLFDNGDFLQGSVLGDLVAGPDGDWAGPHPVIEAMNRLGYDAVNLGNHEFNFGLDWLDHTLAAARFPVICANALRHDGDGVAPLRPPHVLLPLDLRDDQGRGHVLNLGVLGLLPPQITTWDHLHLEGRVTTRGIVETALTEVPLLRAAGADLVIALAHTGLGSAVAPSEHADPGHENAALALARVPGIDAILAGHSHHVFPDIASPRPGAPGVDHRAGTLAGVPAIMAGFRGSHLGVLDLCLAPPRDGAGWTVRASHSRARPVQPDAATAPTPPDPQIERLARPAHRAALRLTARPIGHTRRPLRSYFARILPCDADAPILTAKMWALRNALAGTPHADLPILATTTCFRAGGHAGPDAFVDIPAGPLTLGHVAELYPFPNTLVGLRMTGAQVADWLERAASCFRQLRTGLGNRPQPLWDPAFAGHAFDTVAGLSYRIDLSRPARYDAEGRLVNPDARRIHDLRHGEHPLDPGAVFGVAVNNFRAFGGGPYPGAHPDSILHDARKPVRDHLVAFLRDTGDFDAATLRRRWHLDGPREAVLSIKTGPGVHDHPQDIAALSARDLGLDARGFANLAIPLNALAGVANPGPTS